MRFSTALILDVPGLVFGVGNQNPFSCFNVIRFISPFAVPSIDFSICFIVFFESLDWESFGSSGIR